MPTINYKSEVLFEYTDTKELEHVKSLQPMLEDIDGESFDMSNFPEDYPNTNIIWKYILNKQTNFNEIYNEVWGNIETPIPKIDIILAFIDYSNFLNTDWDYLDHLFYIYFYTVKLNYTIDKIDYIGLTDKLIYEDFDENFAYYILERYEKYFDWINAWNKNFKGETILTQLMVNQITEIIANDIDFTWIWDKMDAENKVIIEKKTDSATLGKESVFYGWIKPDERVPCQAIRTLLDGCEQRTGKYGVMKKRDGKYRWKTYEEFWNDESEEITLENQKKYLVTPNKYRHLWGRGKEWRSIYNLEIESRELSNTLFNNKIVSHVILAPSITNIDWGAFDKCIILSNLIIMGDIDTIGHHAFRRCKQLKHITAKSIHTIEDYAFFECSRLIDPPISTTKIIKNFVFQGCSSIKKIDVSLTHLGKFAFSSCTNLQEVQLNNNSIPPETERNLWCPKDFSRDVVTKLLHRSSYSIEDKELNHDEIKHMIHIGEYAFSDCSKLKSIVMNTIVPVILHDNIFLKCSLLETFIAPNVVKIGLFAFENCNNLENIDIQSCIHINFGAFGNCESITELHLPLLVSIGDYAFLNSSLNHIEMPSIEYIGRAAFTQCKKIKQINLPSSLVSMGGEAFSECSTLNTVNIDEGFTHLKYATFFKCTKLKSIKFPKSLISIGDQCFYNCKLLKIVNIPKHTIYSKDLIDYMSGIGLFGVPYFLNKINTSKESSLIYLQKKNGFINEDSPFEGEEERATFMRYCDVPGGGKCPQDMYRYLTERKNIYWWLKGGFPTSMKDGDDGEEMIAQELADKGIDIYKLGYNSWLPRSAINYDNLSAPMDASEPRTFWKYHKTGNSVGKILESISNGSTLVCRKKWAKATAGSGALPASSLKKKYITYLDPDFSNQETHDGWHTNDRVFPKTTTVIFGDFVAYGSVIKGPKTKKASSNHSNAKATKKLGGGLIRKKYVRNIKTKKY